MRFTLRPVHGIKTAVGGAFFCALMAKRKRDNPEAKFADSLVSAWKMQTGGFVYRIPDARHMRGGQPYSHPRPADYIISCGTFSAFLETKWLRDAKTVIVWNTLTKSQRDTIEQTRDTKMRYYVVVGHHVGAFCFDGHNRLCMNDRWKIGGICPLSWFPSVGCNPSDLVPDMLE